MFETFPRVGDAKIFKKTALGPLYPIVSYTLWPILDQMYTIYARPYFDYCDTIIEGPLTKTDKMQLELTQNHAA